MPSGTLLAEVHAKLRERLFILVSRRGTNERKLFNTEDNQGDDMGRIFKRRYYLAVSTTVVLCGLNQSASAQLQPSSNEGKSEPERFMVRQYTSASSGEEVVLGKRSSAVNRRDAVAHFKIGIDYEVAGRYREAVWFMQKAIETDPTYVPAYNELGVLYCRLSQYAEATNAFKLAINYEPHQPATVANLGTAYFLLGRYSDAADSLRDAVKLDPNFEIARNNLGQALLKTGQYQEAIDCISQVIQQQGRDVAPLYNDIGVAYSHLKRFQDAANYLHLAIQIKENYALARYNLGLVSLRTNDRNAAYDQYVALKSLDRNLADELYTRMFANKILPVEDGSIPHGDRSGSRKR